MFELVPECLSHGNQHLQLADSKMLTVPLLFAHFVLFMIVWIHLEVFKQKFALVTVMQRSITVLAIEAWIFICNWITKRDESVRL